jgi:Abi-like protein
MTINYSALETAISSERLQTFRNQQIDDAATFALYQHNIALCEAFYSSLHVFEVALRNSLEGILKTVFGEEWFSEQRLFNLLSPEDADKIYKALAKLEAANRERRQKKQAEKPTTSGRVVSQLSFGFWTGLLGVDYQQIIWNPYRKRIFPEALPTQRDISRIRFELREIRYLRNRIMHHRPIWQDTRLQDKHANLCKLLGWLSADTALWLAQFDRFPTVHATAVNPAPSANLEGQR